MRIINQSIPGIQKLYNQQKKNIAPSEGSKVGKEDEIALSSEARFYQLAVQALREQSGTPEQKLQELKEAVHTGTYHIKNEQVAEKMLQENTVDKMI